MPQIKAGENRLLLLAVTGRSVKPGSFEQGQPETVRVGSTTLSRFADFDGGQGPDSARGQNHHFFYYVLEEELRRLDLGGNIYILAESNGGAKALAANALLFSGVDQANPIGPRKSTRQEIRCETVQPADTLTLTRAGSVIYSMMAAQETGTEFGVLPPLTWKLRASFPREQVGNREVAILGGVAGVEEVLGSGATALGWTFNTCNNWTVLSVAIQPVLAPATSAR